MSLDAGCSCPNRDGTLATLGCIFCDPESFSPSRRMGLPGVAEQIDEGIRRLRQRYGTRKFVAYFQPGTNTYGPIERLRLAFQQALAHPDVVEAAVIAVPDERWSERPLVAVVLEEGSDTTPDELLVFLTDRVSKWWVPERWSIIDEVPKTSVGKFDKKVLRARYAAGALDVVEVDLTAGG